MARGTGVKGEEAGFYLGDGTGKPRGRTLQGVTSEGTITERN